MAMTRLITKQLQTCCYGNRSPCFRPSFLAWPGWGFVGPPLGFLLTGGIVYLPGFSQANDSRLRSGPRGLPSYFEPATSEPVDGGRT